MVDDVDGDVRSGHTGTVDANRGNFWGKSRRAYKKAEASGSASAHKKPIVRCTPYSECDLCFFILKVSAAEMEIVSIPSSFTSAGRVG
jgi:hypothetical protein